MVILLAFSESNRYKKKEMVWIYWYQVHVAQFTG